MHPAIFFETTVQAQLQAREKHAKLLACDYRFIVEGEAGGIWRLISKNTEHPIILKGDGPADCSLIIHEQVFLDIIEGRLAARTAFLKGKIKVQGNIHAALRLGCLI